MKTDGKTLGDGAEQFLPNNLLVIGGAQGMGAWVVSSFFGKVTGLRITVVDIAPSVMEIGSGDSDSHLTGLLANEATGEVEGVEEGWIREFDAVALCVPISQMDEVAKTHLPMLRDGTLVFDICSIKEAPVASMLRHAAGRLSVVGTHPLFGVKVEPIGQTVVICPTATSNPAHVAWLDEIFRAQGALITREEVKPEASDDDYLELAREHDVKVSITQGLAHFLHYALLRTLATEKISLSSVLRYQTPIFRQLISFSARVISLKEGASAELYASIQRGLARPELRASLIESANALEDAATAKDSSDQLVDIIEGTARSFRQADVDYLRFLSINAISSANEADVILGNCLIHERLCGLELVEENHEGEFEVGYVREISHDSIVFENCLLRRLDTDGKRQYQLVSDERARKRAADLGFSGKPSRPRKLHRRHLRVMRPAEVENWLFQNLLHPKFDLTITTNGDVKPPILAECLESSIPELMVAMVKDTYDAEEGTRITITFECLDRSVTLPRVMEYVTGLGHVLTDPPPS